MNRLVEYEELLASLDAVPESLDATVDRAMIRCRAARTKRRLFGIPLGSLAACFAAFVLLVNLFPPFARACGGLPVLRELAKAVSWSPSLSAAVENDYVQPVGQSQTVNGITATVEYLIVDQKQVHIFFTLKGAGYEFLSAELPRFSPEQTCSVLGSEYRQQPGTLLETTLDYADDQVPQALTMTFGVTAETAEPDSMAAPEQSLEEYLLEEPDPETPDILAEFTFNLTLDPTFTSRGERIAVNETFALDGQILTVTEAEIYPTHVRVNVTGDDGNTAWLESLSFYLENEAGERFEAVSNGITASGDPDSPAMLSYRLESPYFAASRHLTLHITGASWLDKDAERIPVDLARGTAAQLPEGVVLERAEHLPGGWVVTFSATQWEENHIYQLFRHTYYDDAGNEYEMSGSASDSGDGSGRFEASLPLTGYDQDTVRLCPVVTHWTTAAPGVTVSIK